MSKLTSPTGIVGLPSTDAVAWTVTTAELPYTIVPGVKESARSTGSGLTVRGRRSELDAENPSDSLP